MKIGTGINASRTRILAKSTAAALLPKAIISPGRREGLAYTKADAKLHSIHEKEKLNCLLLWWHRQLCNVTDCDYDTSKTNDVIK